MKKNLLKIPVEISAKVKSLQTNEIVVGCAVKFKAATLASNALKHLGVMLTPEGLHVPQSAMPLASQGKYSAKNVGGEEIKRKDLPLETLYHQVDAPNYGDSRRGTHTVDLPYQRYPREFRPPREIDISMTCTDCRPALPVYILAFKVNEVLDRREKLFKEKLLGNLNLLQENIGACGIEAATMALDEYTKSLHVSWEILPPGNREDAIKRIFHGRSPSQQERAVAGDRYDFFVSLKPRQLVFGSSGFRRYFGALIDDNLVVFENIQYGNAIYVLFQNWKELSKLTRIELLSGKYETDFFRIIHRHGWKGEVRAKVKSRIQV